MSDTSTHSDVSANPTSKPRRRRRWIWISLSVVVLILLLIGFAPAILSTSAGTNFALGFINKPGKLMVSVKQLSLSWLSGQSAKGLDIHIPPRDLHVSVDQLNAPKVNLLPVLFGSRDFGTVSSGTVRIQQIAATTSKPSHGKVKPATHRKTKPKPKSKSKSKPKPAPLSPGKLKLTFKAKNIIYDQPRGAPVTLTNVNTSLDTRKLQHIHLSAQADVKQGGKTGRLDTDVTVDNAFNADGTAQWAKASVQVNGKINNLPTALFNMVTAGRVNVPLLLGPTLNASVKASGPLSQLAANITAKSSTLDTNLKLLNQNGALVAGPNSVAAWTLSPKAYTALTGSNQPITLKQPVTFHLALARLKLPTRPGTAKPDLRAGSIDIQLTSSDILLSLPGRKQIALRSLDSTLQSPGFSKKLTAHLTGKVTAAGTTQPVDLSAVLDQPMDLAAAHATVTAKDLPVALVDAVMHQSGRLVETLGPRVTLALTASRKTASRIPFTVQMASANLNGPVSGSIDTQSRSVTLNSPKPISLAIAPKTLADWFAFAQPGSPPRVTLLAPTTVSLNLKDVVVAALPGRGAMQLDPDRSKIDAAVTLPYARLQNARTKQALAVQDARIGVKAPTLRQALTVIANLKLASGEMSQPQSTGQTPAAQPTAGAIKTTTQVSHLFDTQGQLAPMAARLQSHLTAKAVPSQAIDAAAGGNGQLANLLGAKTSATVDATYQKGQPGSAKVGIQSDNVTGQVDAALSANEQLSLNKDAQFKINVTPAVTQTMLRKINPMLAGVRTGSVPMTLTVSKKNFALPIRQFDWSKVSANANLNAGKLTFKPTGLSAILMGVLARLNVVSSQADYNFAMSPVNFKVDRGVLSYDKMALAVAGVNMDFAGRVNLVNRKLNLTLNISGTRKANALANVTLPITGTIDKPKIKTKALINAAVKEGIFQGLKHFGGKDVQKVLPGIEQLLNGNKQQANQPGKNSKKSDQKDQAQQNQGGGGLLGQLLQQLGKKKHDKKSNGQ